ncbi:hypothetical protein [Bradyrhizobium guangzhouense]|uniref:Uncharacterized protein n=1 Tax=Bradyrhizobium guangzhouense TaxID=1325095 RepID=A0AAE6CBI2_9BRAD|nr:hypothetical protein [Bradyrhizobium guangzhouense]QAU49677.1 hypothetical protein XH91_32800 [Bradyrhizobium guangzhouense]
MQDNQTRQDTTSRDGSPDELYSLSLDEAVDIFEEAGLPRTLRAIQRYCALGKLDSHKVETPTGEKYLVTPHSVERLIKYIKEVSRPGATSHDNSRLVATVRALGVKPEVEPRPVTTSIDKPRPVATSDDKYVSMLENQVEFLRGEISVKNTQIAELTERARETNHLIAGLQKMFPLLAAPDRRGGEDGQQP